MKRSLRQNSSLHLYLEMLADALNSAGITLEILMELRPEIPWTAGIVKENIWNPVSIAMDSDDNLSISGQIAVFIRNIHDIIVYSDKSKSNFCENLSDALNEHGFYLQAVLTANKKRKPGKETLKEIWRQFQRDMLGKESTTELTTKEVDAVYLVFDKFTGENFGVHVEFPRWDAGYHESLWGAYVDKCDKSPTKPDI